MSDPCTLDPKVGSDNCTTGGFYTRYYFDGIECKSFTYGGCGGNANNFESMTSCIRECINPLYTTTSYQTTMDSSDGDEPFSGYHVAGFVMICLVICIFAILYYLKNVREANDDNSKYEPHQYKLTVSGDNKWANRNCLYVSNISKHAIQNDIKQLFEDYGKISKFEFKETRGDQLNICFIEFKSCDDAQRAMGELNGCVIPPQNGNKLIIKPGSEYNPNPTKQTKPKGTKMELVPTHSDMPTNNTQEARDKMGDGYNNEKQQQRTKKGRKSTLSEEKKRVKREKRLKERERRREERRIREKLGKEVQQRNSRRGSEAASEPNDDKKENKDANDDKGDDEDVVLVDMDKEDGDPLDDIEVNIQKQLLDVEMDIDAIVANKNSYIAENPMTPRSNDSSEDSSGDDESDKNNKSSTKSMGDIDSEFEDYGDDHDYKHPRNTRQSIIGDNRMSDSDHIDFGGDMGDTQRNALQQFVQKKLTMDDKDIDTNYDWNAKLQGVDEDDDKMKKDDYIGVDTFED